ncbi:hypothetical protein ACFQ46_18105 [Kineococcus sp. GCM10028916]|uniref:hypothetical protein n=1 Tax=Kineococcus sp. GCM10028916 TaxID=3273394 RepID=UPI0036425A2B
MPSESPADVVRELRKHLNESLAAQFFATEGLQHMRNQLQQIRPDPSNPNPKVMLGYGKPVGPNPPHYASLPRSTAVYHLRRNGEVEDRLGQQWIVAFCSTWDEEFRLRLEAAHGCPENAIRVDAFGDLRLMRHDIVHGRGQASLANTGRCKVLHWFRPPHCIRPSMPQLGELPDLVPWAALEQGPWPRP